MRERKRINSEWLQLGWFLRVCIYVLMCVWVCATVSLRLSLRKHAPGILNWSGLCVCVRTAGGLYHSIIDAGKCSCLFSEKDIDSAVIAPAVTAGIVPLQNSSRSRRRRRRKEEHQHLNPSPSHHPSQSYAFIGILSTEHTRGYAWWHKDLLIYVQQ